MTVHQHHMMISSPFYPTIISPINPTQRSTKITTINDFNNTIPPTSHHPIITRLPLRGWAPGCRRWSSAPAGPRASSPRNPRRSWPSPSPPGRRPAAPGNAGVGGDYALGDVDKNGDVQNPWFFLGDIWYVYIYMYNIIYLTYLMIFLWKYGDLEGCLIHGIKGASAGNHCFLPVILMTSHISHELFRFHSIESIK